MGSPTFSYKPDIVEGYLPADKDEAASPYYYGFSRADKSWYILQRTITGSVDAYRYAKGSKNYPTNWTNRGTLTYDYYHEVF